MKALKNQPIFIGKRLYRRLDYQLVQRHGAVKDAQRGEADSLTAAGGCAIECTSNLRKGLQMKDEINVDDYFPTVMCGGRKLRLMPNQMDLLMEDGTVYHVRSFFPENANMGELLDALNAEKIERSR